MLQLKLHNVIGALSLKSSRKDNLDDNEPITLCNFNFNVNSIFRSICLYLKKYFVRDKFEYQVVTEWYNTEKYFWCFFFLLIINERKGFMIHRSSVDRIEHVAKKKRYPTILKSTVNTSVLQI